MVCCWWSNRPRLFGHFCSRPGFRPTALKSNGNQRGLRDGFDASCRRMNEPPAALTVFVLFLSRLPAERLQLIWGRLEGRLASQPRVFPSRVPATGFGMEPTELEPVASEAGSGGVVG